MCIRSTLQKALMKKMSKILPSVCVILFVLLVFVWQLSDWSFISVLPYLLLGASLTTGSFSVSVSTGSQTKWITWSFLLTSLLIHLLVFAGIAEIRAVWKTLIFLGVSGIFLYLFELTKRSSLFGKHTVKVATIPAAIGILFSLLFLFTESLLGLVFLGLIVGVLLTISGLLFGFRKTR